MGTVANINSVFVTPSRQVNLSHTSGIEMSRLRKVMSQLKKIKHADYHKAMSDLLRDKIIPNLPRDVSFILRVLFYFSDF